MTAKPNSPAADGPRRAIMMPCTDSSRQYMLDWNADMARRIDWLRRQTSPIESMDGIANIAADWRKVIWILRARVADAKRMVDSLPAGSVERSKHGAKVAHGEMDLATAGSQLTEFWDAICVHDDYLPGLKLTVMKDGLRLRPGADETDDALLRELDDLHREARRRAIRLAVGIDMHGAAGGEGKGQQTSFPKSASSIDRKILNIMASDPRKRWSITGQDGIYTQMIHNSKFRVGLRTISPALAAMCARGLVISDGNGKGKRYTITDDGKAAVKEPVPEQQQSTRRQARPLPKA